MDEFFNPKNLRFAVDEEEDVVYLCYGLLKIAVSSTKQFYQFAEILEDKIRKIETEIEENY